ncbi:unnamed protein product, partial [Mesorhabditis belari]|uniref:Uncharacterized protein n=1 Tax=Mesorhabditis belari TaxID=2138241 RepID=A0AAF3EXA2_9BILA
MFSSLFFSSVILGLSSASVLTDFPPGYFCYTDGHLHTDDPCRFFAAVIDAGSTGTRLHLYRFVHNTLPHSLPFVTEEEIFKEVKPGLSAFHDNPKGAALSVRELLDKAHEEIPPELWEKTPIALKATAGLRLLPKGQADAILEEVQTEVLSSGFFLAENAVEILDGRDEGVFSWFTLNLLLNTLFQKSNGLPADPAPSRTVAAFDLGGGSTQVTFWPSDDSLFYENREYRKDIDFFDTHMHLFSHSFLGNGLISARLGVLMGSTNPELQSDDHLTSPCMPEDFEIPNWQYALKSWRVRGNPEYSESKCATAVRSFVRQSSIVELDYLKGKPIYLFSYFFDRALNAGIVKDSNGGKTTLGEFEKAAKIACHRDSSTLNHGAHWLPWQCMDLLYIHSLLKDGYGFENSQPLVLAKKLRGMEVSWGQGLAYSLVNEFHETALPDIGGAQINATGSVLVDQFLTILYQRTDDLLKYLNLIS